MSDGVTKFDPSHRQFQRPAPKEEGAATATVPEGFTPITQSLPDDIFIVGYPKSGNTWFQNLIAGIVYGVDPPFGPTVLAHDLVPGLSSGKYCRRYATPKFFKLHALPCLEYRRVVYLRRDGRDVMVSYRRDHEATLGKQFDFLQYVAPETKFYPCSWAQHVDAWMQNPYRAYILIIKYEDLLREPVTELQRFCKFAGVSRENKHLASIAGAAALRNLREREERIGFGRADVKFLPGKFFFRREVAGSHKDEMPPEVLETSLGHAGETLRRCGFTIGEQSEDDGQQANESCEHLGSPGQ